MEEHRLKPMVEGYDKELFNDLYKKTLPLRKRIASQIDPKRFGLEYEDIISALDIKFLFVFQKYHKIHKPDTLLGHIISSLSTYKNRILRTAYNNKNAIHQQTIDIEELVGYENAFVDRNPLEQNKELFLNLAMSFLEKHLTEDALKLMQLELNPPEYIMDKLPEKAKKIPNELIIGYFDMEEGMSDYIDSLRKEINKAIKKAKEHFSNNVPQFQLN